jgi:Rod binding domain-containing protein
MKPYRDFEAFVLQSFVQSMLPNEAEDVFGRGTAGAMWKGLLAEQLGKQLARSGGIGIAAAVAKAHPGAAKGGALAANGLLPLSPLRTNLARHDIGAQMAALSQPVAGLGGGTISKRTP